MTTISFISNKEFLQQNVNLFNITKVKYSPKKFKWEKVSLPLFSPSTHREKLQTLGS